jgi:hypothetical protein
MSSTSITSGSGGTVLHVGSIEHRVEHLGERGHIVRRRTGSGTDEELRNLRLGAHRGRRLWLWPGLRIRSLRHRLRFRLWFRLDRWLVEKLRHRFGLRLRLSSGSR